MKKKLLIIIAAITFMGCKKENNTPSLDVKNLEIYFDQEHQFVFKKGNKIATSNSWVSSDSKIGTVNSSGLFKAKKIGSTTVEAEGATCIITVKPYVNWVEPYIGFGSSSSTVKTKETRLLQSQTSTNLWYKGGNLEIANVAYAFENDKMKSAAIFFNDISGIVDKFQKFFPERYPSQSQDGDYIVFTDNSKVMIGLGYDATIGFHAIYIPFSSSGNVTSTDLLKETLQTRFKEIAAKLVPVN